MMEFTNIEALVLALGSLGLGMIMLIKGGNWTIDAAIFVAKKIGVSPLVIGFTIVAFGTSLPELIVSINANLSGVPGIAIGNVLGSNVANILLVIGATAFVSTIVAVPSALLRDLVMMLLATVMLLAMMLYGDISRMAGGAMIAVLALYSVWQYVMARRGEIPVEELDEPVYKTMRASLSFLILGLIFISLGAEFLVRGAKVTATVIGVPDAVIGLSIIALGTSLPELSTCLIAAMKKQSDLVLGNIIGSNVFNILMIVGATALVKPIDMSTLAPQLVQLDIWITLGVSVVFTAILLFYKKVGRYIGSAFMVGYLVYILAIYYKYMN